MQRLLRAALREALPSCTSQFHRAWSSLRCGNRVPLSSTSIFTCYRDATSLHTPSALSSSSLLQMRIHTRGGRDDGDDEIEEFDSDDSDEVEIYSEDEANYESDPETESMLERESKSGKGTPPQPLPLYKAREMVDYRVWKESLDAIEILTDPTIEEEMKTKLQEGIHEFFTNTTALFKQIDAEEKKSAEKIKDDKREKKAPEIAGENQEGGREMIEDGAAAPAMDGRTLTGEESLKIGGEESLKAEEGETAEIEDDILSIVAAFEALKFEEKDAKMVLRDVTEAENEQVLIREQEMKEMAKQSKEKKGPSLRWRTQVVLGPGEAWHPSNRKVKVSVYVKELGLSKHANLRLRALVGKRYNSAKDELTVVSERYQHRYENQKDVLRTLLALIEEAKKADKLVLDAKDEFLKSKQSQTSTSAIS